MVREPRGHSARWRSRRSSPARTAAARAGSPPRSAPRPPRRRRGSCRNLRSCWCGRQRPGVPMVPPHCPPAPAGPHAVPSPSQRRLPCAQPLSHPAACVPQWSSPGARWAARRRRRPGSGTSPRHRGLSPASRRCRREGLARRWPSGHRSSRTLPPSSAWGWTRCRRGRRGQGLRGSPLCSARSARRRRRWCTRHRTGLASLLVVVLWRRRRGRTAARPARSWRAYGSCPTPQQTGQGSSAQQPRGLRTSLSCGRRPSRSLRTSSRRVGLWHQGQDGHSSVDLKYTIAAMIAAQLDSLPTKVDGIRGCEAGAGGGPVARRRRMNRRLGENACREYVRLGDVYMHGDHTRLHSAPHTARTHGLPAELSPLAEGGALKLARAEVIRQRLNRLGSHLSRIRLVRLALTDIEDR